MRYNILRYTNNSKTLRGKNPALSFSIPAGYTCPAASICQTFACRETGKLKKGKDQQFNCYAAKIEARYPSARNMYWDNFEILKLCKGDVDKMAAKIQEMVNSMPRNINYLRIHSSGDFFSKEYAEAWNKVAHQNKEIIFYGYSKTLFPFQVQQLDNWRWTYSHGGKLDTEAETLNLPTCFVITKANKETFAHIEVDETDCDDFAKQQDGKTSFGLLYH